VPYTDKRTVLRGARWASPWLGQINAHVCSSSSPRAPVEGEAKEQLSKSAERKHELRFPHKPRHENSPKKEMTEGGKETGAPGDPVPPGPPVDQGMVKDAIREIVGEIPAFKSLLSGGAPTPGDSQPPGKYIVGVHALLRGPTLHRMTWHPSWGRPLINSTDSTGLHGE
jgi:hypothetical protein